MRNAGKLVRGGLKKSSVPGDSLKEGQKAREALIESARVKRRDQMVRFKAQIAGHSGSMGKICNAEAEHLGRRITAHDSIRASQDDHPGGGGEEKPGMAVCQTVNGFLKVRRL